MGLSPYPHRYQHGRAWLSDRSDGDAESQRSRRLPTHRHASRNPDNSRIKAILVALTAHTLSVHGYTWAIIVRPHPVQDGYLPSDLGVFSLETRSFDSSL